MVTATCLVCAPIKDGEHKNSADKEIIDAIILISSEEDDNLTRPECQVWIGYVPILLFSFRLVIGDLIYLPVFARYVLDGSVNIIGE